MYTYHTKEQTYKIYITIGDYKLYLYYITLLLYYTCACISIVYILPKATHPRQ